MGKLTEHVTLPPESKYRPPVQPDTFGIDESTLVSLTRDQQRRATAVVLNHLGDGPEARKVLHALLQPARQTDPVNTGRTYESVRRQEKLGKMRRWMDEEGLPLTPGGFVSRSAEAAYDRAHPGGAQ
jgi:hypothetical protein